MSENERRRVVLGFFAHPDDAEIVAGGTLTRLHQLGWQVHIATATAGDCGSQDQSPQEIAAIRRGEAKRAAAVLDGTYHCLELSDVQVCFDRDSNRKAIDLFRQVAPSLVITHPRHDYMIDHEQVHLLARSASFAYSIANASALPLIPGSCVPHLYYSDPIEGLDPYHGQLVTPTTRIDVSDVIETKLEMLACHESQRQWLRSHHGMDEYLDATRRHAATRGGEAGVAYAEAFVQHAGHAYPHDDVLNDLLSQ